MLCLNFRNFGLKLLRSYEGHWLVIIGLNIIEYFKILISLHQSRLITKI
jgi:hypothetical protein